MEALIIDVDGVLVDTHKLHVSALSRAVAQHCPDHVWSELVGDTRTTIEKLRTAGIYASKIPEIYETKKFIYDNEVHEYIFPRPEVRAHLIALGKKFKLGICSNSNTRSVMRVLTIARLHDLFDVFVCGGMFGQGKPASAPYDIVSNLLNVDPAKCLVFEDSEAGIKSATDAGMKVVRTSYQNLEKDLYDARNNLGGGTRSTLLGSGFSTTKTVD